MYLSADLVLARSNMRDQFNCAPNFRLCNNELMEVIYFLLFVKELPSVLSIEEFSVRDG